MLLREKMRSIYLFLNTVNSAPVTNWWNKVVHYFLWEIKGCKEISMQGLGYDTLHWNITQQLSYYKFMHQWFSAENEIFIWLYSKQNTFRIKNETAENYKHNFHGIPT